MGSVFGISDMSIKCQVMCTRLKPKVVIFEGESKRNSWWWMLGDMKEMETTVLKREGGSE